MTHAALTHFLWGKILTEEMFSLKCYVAFCRRGHARQNFQKFCLPIPRYSRNAYNFPWRYGKIDGIKTWHSVTNKGEIRNGQNRFLARNRLTFMRGERGQGFACNMLCQMRKGYLICWLGQNNFSLTHDRNRVSYLHNLSKFMRNKNDSNACLYERFEEIKKIVCFLGCKNRCGFVQDQNASTSI